MLVRWTLRKFNSVFGAKTDPHHETQPAAIARPMSRVSDRGEDDRHLMEVDEGAAAAAERPAQGREALPTTESPVAPGETDASSPTTGFLALHGVIQEAAHPQLSSVLPGPAASSAAHAVVSKGTAVQRSFVDAPPTQHVPQRPQIQTHATVSNPHVNTGAGLLTTAQKYLSKYPLHPRFVKEYAVVNELGDGGFGFVISCVQKSTGKMVAAKFIFKTRVPVNAWVRDPEIGVCPLEAYILRNLHHRSIVGFIDYLEDERFSYLIMEMHGVPWTSSKDAAHRNQENKAAGAAGTSGDHNDMEVDTAREAPQPPIIARPPLPTRATVAVLPSAHSSYGDAGPSVADSTSPTNPDHSSHLLHPAVQRIQAQHGLKPPPSPLDRPARPGIERNMTHPPPLSRRTSMDLFECIEQCERLTEDQARYVFRQLLEAVAYLHAKGIVHRDLKDENIVVDDRLQVKLIDFGSAAIEPRGQPNFLFDSFFGTIQYAAPEILRGEKYRGRPNDMWALGILLYTIIFGETPFTGTDHALHRDPRPHTRPVSADCSDLLDRLLRKGWRDRITAADALRHPWVRKGRRVAGDTGGSQGIGPEIAGRGLDAGNGKAVKVA